MIVKHFLMIMTSAQGKLYVVFSWLIRNKQVWKGGWLKQNYYQNTVTYPQSPITILEQFLMGMLLCWGLGSGPHWEGVVDHNLGSIRFIKWKVHSTVWREAVVGIWKPVFSLQDTAAGQMLVVAAAVGVSSCFGAPVSGERAAECSALFLFIPHALVRVALCF